jgi:hypothetical protein
MAEFISREDAVQCANDLSVDLFNDGLDSASYGAQAVAEWLKDFPAADVVEVVRCKDCRFYYKDSDGYEMCDASEGYDHISADGFCAWAKRRADDG